MSDIPSGMQYPLMQNDYGNVVPIRDFFDLDDLAQQAFRNNELHPQLSRINMPVGARPLTISSQEERIQQFRPTEQQRTIFSAQSEITLKAIESQMTYHGLETGIFYPLAKRLMGDLDIAPDIEIMKRYCIEKGVVDADDPDINMKVTRAIRTNMEVRDFNMAQQRREYYGRNLTDEEEFKCVAAGLSPQAVAAVAKYVENGYDFNASFEMMDKMAWAKWARDTRKFTSFDNLFSMGVEMVTDPLTYLPYGIALKFPTLVARAISRGALSRVGLKTLRNIGGGAFVSGGAGFTYAQIRNYQGIDEDVWGITASAAAFGGALGFLGGLGKGAKAKGSESVDRIASNIGESFDEAKIMDGIHQEVKKSPFIGIQAVGAAVAQEKFALGEIAKIKELIFKEEDRFLALEIKGKVTPGEVSNHYKILNDYKKQIQDIDDAVAKAQEADRQMGAEALEFAATKEEALKTGSSRFLSEYEFPTDADFTTAQKWWRKFTSWIPNWTYAGTLDFDMRAPIQKWASIWKHNEQGFVMKNKATGKLQTVRSADVNLYDTLTVTRDRLNVPLNDFINKASEHADNVGIPIQELFDKCVWYMETHRDMRVRLSDSEMKIIEPLLSMFRDAREMALDQSRVIGVPERIITNQKGELQSVPIEPLMTTMPDNYFPTVIDIEKLRKIKQTRLEKIKGWDSTNTDISNEAHKMATNSIINEVENGLYKGTRDNETLLKVFDTRMDEDDAFKLSRNKNYVSDVQKAINKADALYVKITKLENEIKVAKSKNRGTKGKEKDLANANKALSDLGVGDVNLGNTYTEQIYRKIRDKQLHSKAHERAVGIVNQNYEHSVGWDNNHGFGGIDHTEHKGDWWDNYFKNHESEVCLADITDKFIPRIADNYNKQLSARLSANQIIGAKNFSEVKAWQSNWETDFFGRKKAGGKLSKKDQQVIQAQRGIIMGGFGITAKGGNHLGGNVVNATAVEGTMEALKLFTAISKNGFFWFYNPFEATSHFYSNGAIAWLKGLPVVRSMCKKNIIGKATDADMRMFRGLVFSDELGYTRDWNQLRMERAGKYGEKSIIGKIVTGLDYAYRNSPLSRLQSHTQITPEMQATEYLLCNLAEYAHSGVIPKKGYAKGFFNQKDFPRMGIRADELDRLTTGLKKATYFDGDELRLNPDELSKMMTPANRDVIHRMASFVRDEAIQGRSFIDNPLYGGTKYEPFWEMFTQFRSFSMQSFRKKLLKQGNRIAYEGAAGEAAIQMGINIWMGMNLTMLKTIIRAQTMINDKDRENYLMATLGIRGLSELDLNDSTVWSNLFKNGFMESSWFAGFSWAASLMSSSAAMRNTSGQDVSFARPVKGAPQVQSVQWMLSRNIPLIGKTNEIIRSFNTITKYGMSPSKFRDVNNTYKDMTKILKTFIPNDPLSGAALRGFYEIIKNPD